MVISRKVLNPYQAQIGGKFAALNFMTDDLDSVTENINQAIPDTAEEVLERESKKIQSYSTDNILELCDKRRSLQPVRFEPQNREKI